MADRRSPPGIEERRDRDGRLRYRVRVRRAGGYQTATLPTLEGALAWRARALAAADGSGDPPEKPRRVLPEQPRVPTVEEACRRFCRAMRDGSARSRTGATYRPSVARTYEESLRLDVVRRIGAVPVTTLTRGDVQRLVDEIAAQRTSRHAQKALTALRVMLHFCERHGELEMSPCVRIRVPTDDAGERPARILTPAECSRLLAAAEADDRRLKRSFAAPLLTLALATGLRLGELLALRWGRDGLDLDAGVVRVRQSLDRVRDETGEFAIVPPKSRAGRRDVPIVAEDVARLRRHRLATGRPAAGQLVFANALGKPLPAQGAPRKAWDRAIEAAKLAEPLPRFHDLRHAYATHALASGLSAHAVARLLGHADAGLVWRRYGHALPNELADAGRTLSAWRARAAQDRPTARRRGRKALQVAT